MTRSSSLFLTSIVCVLVAFGGCRCPSHGYVGDGGSDAGFDAGGNDAGEDAGGDAGPDGGHDCSPGIYSDGGEASQSSSSVIAKILDETGAAVASQPVYICGLNLCSPAGMTAGDGTVTISSSLNEKKPAFKVGDAVSYSELAIPLTAATTDFTDGGAQVLNVGKLSDKTGAALTPGADAVSGDVTVSVPTGASVSIDELIYSTTDQQKFRSVSIPVANDGPWLASSGVSGFVLLYGVAPAETPICPPAKITVALPHGISSPNDFGWAAGDAVEFWITTTDTGQTFAPYAGWTKASDGTVSADGHSVSTTDGFIFLENFAIRKTPG